MIGRANDRRLAADTAYGAAPVLKWLMDRGIEPHIPVWDKSRRADGTFSRPDFTYDKGRDFYICPGGKALFQMMGVFAEFERAMIQERVHAEPHRVCRRLQLLRDWSYDKANLSEIFIGSARACRTDGA